MAPKAHIIAVKVLDRKGNGTVKRMVEGLKWVIENKEKYNIRIVNISVGTLPAKCGKEHEKLLRATEDAWDSGLVVVAAAGNEGPGKMSVTTPGICKQVITVGACDDDNPVWMGRKKFVNYSGRGPTAACIVKPEIVAPGSNITSCSHVKNGYAVKSGTSMATPIVSGAIALLLEQYPDMKNYEVKMRLYERAVDLGLPKNRQGWGTLEIDKLLIR